MEQVEWMNKIVVQMWPFVDEYVADVMKTTVEPLINASMPSIFQPFVFRVFKLGDQPPVFNGVQVYTSMVPEDKIIIDVDMKFRSNVDIRVSVSGIDAGITDLSVVGRMRVVIWPLIGRIPLFGGLNFFFLDEPLIEFDLKGVANVLDFPLVGSSLRDAIRQQISGLMVLPNSIPVSLSPTVDNFSLKYMEPSGVVRFNMLGARDLIKTDFNLWGKTDPDPYVRIKHEGAKLTTRVINSSSNPVWNEYIEIITGQIHGQSIQINVLDEDIGEDDHLGRTTLSIEKLVMAGNIQPVVKYPNQWVQLDNVSAGELHYRAEWLTLSKHSSDLQKVTYRIL